MDRLAAGSARRLDQPADVEVRIDRRRRPDRHGELRGADVRRQTISVRIDGDRFEALLVAGADDAERDFAPVGDEDARDLSHQRSALSRQR